MVVTPDMAQANLLRRIRRAAGLTQAQLAAKAGVHLVTIGGIERLGHPPRLATRQKLASALGVEVADIWPDDREVQ